MRDELIAMAIAAVLVFAFSFKRDPKVGTVLEKSHYPEHVTTVPDVANGEGMVWAEPGSAKVYEIAPMYHHCAEQWIIKIAMTNLSGKYFEAYAVTSFDVWRSNRVGEPFEGWIFNKQVVW